MARRKKPPDIAAMLRKIAKGEDPFITVRPVQHPPLYRARRVYRNVRPKVGGKRGAAPKIRLPKM